MKNLSNPVACICLLAAVILTIDTAGFALDTAGPLTGAKLACALYELLLAALIYGAGALLGQEAERIDADHRDADF